MVHLNYRDARPIYAQIVDGYRGQITAGILEVGDKLPSVRELATELSINPNTIQRAYRQLESDGWIATVPGKGCFVCGTPRGSRQELNDLLRTFDETVTALSALGITREEVMAFGDGANDLPMLRHAGISVVMGSAADDVKAQGDYVTGTADEDGIATALAHFGLI